MTNPGMFALANNTSLEELNIISISIVDENGKWAGDPGMAALACNTTLKKLIRNSGFNDAFDKVYMEPNPFKRSNLAGSYGAVVEVPSLLKLSAFAVKENPDLKKQGEAILTEELKELINKPRL